jgi:hypothetical protein
MNVGGESFVALQSGLVFLPPKFFQFEERLKKGNKFLILLAPSF